MLRWILLAWVILIVVVAIMLVVQLLCVLLGLVLGLFAIDPIGSLGLGEAIDFGAGEASKKLLGECVGDGLAWGNVRRRVHGIGG